MLNKSSKIIQDAIKEILDNSQTIISGKKEEEITILLMFSGGLDSTSILWALLKNTKCKIHAHHVTLLQNHNRHISEKEAVEKIVSYCKSHSRDFKITYSDFDERSYGGYGGLDSQIWTFVGGRICKSLNNIDILMIDSGMDTHKKHWNYEIREISGRLAILDAMYQYQINAKKPELIFGLYHAFIENRVFHQVNSMPQELQNMFTSCREPIKENNKLIPCKKCFACEKLLNITKDSYLQDSKSNSDNRLNILLNAIFNNASNEEIEKIYLDNQEAIKKEIDISKECSQYNLIDILNLLLSKDIKNFSWDEKDNHWKRIEILLDLGADIHYIIQHHNRTISYFKVFLDQFGHLADKEKIKKMSVEMSWDKIGIKKVRGLIENNLVSIDWIVDNHNKKQEYYQIFQDEMKDILENYVLKQKQG